MTVRTWLERGPACVLRFLDALIPCGCALCGAGVKVDGPPLCPQCAARVAPVPPPLCPRCGLTRVIPGPGSADCSECHAWPPALPRATSACLHAGRAADLVRGLKYSGWTGLADYMGGLMVPGARRLTRGAVPSLVPVPLTRARRRERGFNQSELLASALCRRTGWPVAAMLRRDRGGSPSARLGRVQREEAARGAFSIDSSVACLGGSSTAALLVDDVITTGSTAIACALALERGGVTCLGITSFARTSEVVRFA